MRAAISQAFALQAADCVATWELQTAALVEELKRSVAMVESKMVQEKDLDELADA